MTFEDRHRALRSVSTRVTPNGTVWKSVDRPALLAFNDRTSPLVDEVVAAARGRTRCEFLPAYAIGAGYELEQLLFGQPCGKCRACKLAVALVALDEAAAR